MKSAAEWGQEYLNTSIKGIDFIRAIQLDAALAQREADAKSVDRALGGSFWAARQAEVDALHAEARYWKDVAEAQREEMQKLRAEVAAAIDAMSAVSADYQEAKADLVRTEAERATLWQHGLDMSRERDLAREALELAMPTCHQANHHMMPNTTKDWRDCPTLVCTLARAALKPTDKEP